MSEAVIGNERAGSGFRLGGLGWAAVALLVVAADLGSTYLGGLVPPRVDMDLLQPLLWLLPAALAVYFIGTRRRAVLSAGGLALPGAAIGMGQVAIAFAAALALGFGRSPYGHSPLSILSDLWYVVALLAGREVARWYLVRALERRGELLAVGFTAALLWLATLAPSAYTLLGDPRTAFDYLGKIALPAAAASLLATYLALLGGPLASMAYLGVLAAFEWLPPALPNLPWPVAALIGVVVPLVGLVLIQPASAAPAAQAAATVDKSGSSGALVWIAAALVALLVFWFNTGVFGVRPVLIQGISMEPGMHTGDIAVTRQVPLDSLKTGDVIKFREGSHDVLHRIIAIKNGPGGPVFTTKGDNNPAPDPPVAAKDVEGRMVLHVPKIGLPGTYLKELLTALVH